MRWYIPFSFVCSFSITTAQHAIAMMNCSAFICCAFMPTFLDNIGTYMCCKRENSKLLCSQQYMKKLAFGFRRLKRSKFFVFWHSIFNVENEFFFFLVFDVPIDKKSINKICSSIYINEINNSYTQIKKIGSVIKGNWFDNYIIYDMNNKKIK